MGLRKSSVVGVLLIWVILQILQSTPTVEAQEPEPPNISVDYQITHVDGDFDIFRNIYVNELFQKVMIKVKIIDRDDGDPNITYDVHFVAVKSEYLKDIYGRPTIYDTGKQWFDGSNSLKDSFEVDIEKMRWTDIREEGMDSVHVNYTFKSTGVWSIGIIQEHGPSKYVLTEDTINIKIQAEEQDLAFGISVAISLVFMVIAVYLALPRYMKDDLEGRKVKHRMTKSKKMSLIGLVTTFTVVLIVFSSFFMVVFPKPVFVMAIKGMDGEIAPSGVLHIAWLKSGYSIWDESEHEINREVFDDSSGGYVMYTRWDLNTGNRCTMMVSDTRATHKVNLVLDSEWVPHISWTSHDGELSYAKIVNMEIVEKFSTGGRKDFHTPHIDRTYFNDIEMMIAGNDTVYIFEEHNNNFITVFDNGSWAENNLPNRYNAAYFDDEGLIHHLFLDHDEINDTIILNYTIEDNGVLTNVGYYDLLTEDTSHEWMKMSIRTTGALNILHCDMEYQQHKRFKLISTYIEGNETHNYSLDDGYFRDYYSRRSFKLEDLNDTLVIRRWEYRNRERSDLTTYYISKDGEAWDKHISERFIHFFFKKDGLIYSVSSGPKVVKEEKNIINDIQIQVIS